MLHENSSCKEWLTDQRKQSISLVGMQKCSGAGLFLDPRADERQVQACWLEHPALGWPPALPGAWESVPVLGCWLLAKRPAQPLDRAGLLGPRGSCCPRGRDTNNTDILTSKKIIQIFSDRIRIRYSLKEFLSVCIRFRVSNIRNRFVSECSKVIFLLCRYSL